MSNTAEVRMSAGDTVAADMTGNEKPAKRKKNKFQKRLLRFLKWFAIVFAVLLLLLLIFRDSIIKSCISHIGSNLAGTDITIEELETTLDGEIRITNLTIANPHGFREKNMLTVSSVYVNIGIASLFSDEFVVEEADINELKLNWEFKSRSGSNNIQTFADKFKNDDADNNSSTKATIHKFALRNSSISISNEEDNFLIGIGELTGSTSAGNANFTALEITTPRNFDAKKMVTLKEAQIEFDGNSLYSERLMIDKIFVNSLKIHCEFSSKGSFSPKTAADILAASPDSSDADTTGKTSDTDMSTPEVKISRAIIRDSELKIVDHRTGGTILLPLAGDTADILFDSQGSIMTTIHDSIDGLADSLGAVTNAPEMLKKNINKTGNFLKDTGSKVLKIFLPAPEK